MPLPALANMSLDGVAVIRQGIFGLIILVLVCGLEFLDVCPSRGKKLPSADICALRVVAVKPLGTATPHQK